MQEINSAHHRAGIGDAELDRAADVVTRYLAATPLVRLVGESGQTPVYLKLETTQPSGSFKVRGAIAAASEYAADGGAIVTASAGNHGLGIAFAADVLGVEATVVLPENASPAKIDALRRYRVNLVLAGSGYDEAELVAKEIASRGARFISAYNDPFVVAGQATLVTEVAAQLQGDFDIVVPVGGGGLVAGTAVAARRLARGISVIGVETRQSRAVSASVEAGRVVQVPIGSTIADGLAGNIEDSTITPAIAAEAGVIFRSVSEDAIRRGVRELALSCGIVAEGSGAVGFAAYREKAFDSANPLVLVITGRNIAATLLTEILGIQ